MPTKRTGRKRKGQQQELFSSFLGGFFDAEGKDVTRKTDGRQLEFGFGREPLKRKSAKTKQFTMFNPKRRRTLKTPRNRR